MNSQDYPYSTRIIVEGADRDFDTRFERGLTGSSRASPRPLPSALTA